MALRHFRGSMRTNLVTALLGASVLTVAATGGVFLAAEHTPTTQVAAPPLKGAVPMTASAPATAAPVVLKGCADFSTLNAANAYLRVTPAAKPKLDSNGNGVACEVKFAPRPTTTSRPTAPTEAQLESGCSTEPPRYSASECGRPPASSYASVTPYKSKPFCPTDQGPIAGHWCSHSANGPDNPGFVAQCPVPGLPKVYWPAAVNGKCS
jgi:hypothetical protein